MVYEPQKAALGLLSHYAPKDGPKVAVQNNTINLPPELAAQVYKALMAPNEEGGK